jgi:sec-independent protein translocase protein TatA
MNTLGPWELLIILAIIVAIFGAGKIAGMGAALGNSIREFKRAINDGEASTSNASKAEKPPSQDL